VISSSEKYNVILADPPWSYRDKCNSGKRGASHKYRCMTMRDLLAMRDDVLSVAAEDCFLFMWAPTTHTIEARKLIEGWGFRFRAARAWTWIKTTSKGGLAWGMGTLTRSNPEDVWCGVRGKPKRASAGVHSVIMAPRREHSRKPDELYDAIEKLCGPGPKLELFAQQRWPGWDQHGNEIDKFKAISAILSGS
jgi:N6-adenosine-specific RNA methylase IME4